MTEDNEVSSVIVLKYRLHGEHCYGNNTIIGQMNERNVSAKKSKFRGRLSFPQSRADPTTGFIFVVCVNSTCVFIE